MTAPIDYTSVEQAAQVAGLEIYGGFHPGAAEEGSLSSGTLILLGTAGAFWGVFRHSPEHGDSAPDPIDRWSTRVISNLAADLGAKPHYPFTGPPYAPFIRWALMSGRAFTSPSQMLVHDAVGMMVSYRGALHFAQEFNIPSPPLAQSPCLSCSAKPCLTSCPVNAMVDGGPYGLALCHNHLDTATGGECLSRGCLARRACPLSAGASRCFDQSAHHMGYFHN